MLDNSKRAKVQEGLSIHWHTFWAMARKELTILSRYPIEFIASFGQVFLIVAIFTLAGLMFSDFRDPTASSAAPAQFSYSGVTVYGFILFMFLSDTLWSIGYNIRHEQIQGTLEQLYLSPANKFLNLIARVISILLWTGLASFVAALLMSSMIGHLPIKNPLLGLYILLVSLSGTFGIGFAFAALTIRIKEAAQTAANFLQFIFLILCANFFPFSALPPFLRFFSRLLPTAYCVDAFRSAMMGFPPGFPELAPFEIEFIIVTLFGIFMPIIGYRLYRASERYARQAGTLSGY
ncbi:MAG: ABC transporter permease [Anaerolineales bacterium]|nr:ABC transporter permease [Anaerolineales bacterium]